ncbi:MAG: hypothetical protein V3W14_09715, partial [Candidatus Neomarinimicrobiota bacterium]
MELMRFMKAAHQLITGRGAEISKRITVGRLIFTRQSPSKGELRKMQKYMWFALVLLLIGLLL